MKLNKALVFAFLLCLTASVVAEAPATELQRIRAEREKIESYLSQGQGNNELKTELKKLTDREAELKRAIAQNQKKKRRSPRKSEVRTASRPRVSYSLDQSLPLQEQYQQVLRDLEQEQEALAGLEQSLQRGVASLSGGAYADEPAKNCLDRGA